MKRKFEGFCCRTTVISLWASVNCTSISVMSSRDTSNMWSSVGHPHSSSRPSMATNSSQRWPSKKNESSLDINKNIIWIRLLPHLHPHRQQKGRPPGKANGTTASSTDSTRNWSREEKISDRNYPPCHKSTIFSCLRRFPFLSTLKEPNNSRTH